MDTPWTNVDISPPNLRIPETSLLPAPAGLRCRIAVTQNNDDDFHMAMTLYLQHPL